MKHSVLKRIMCAMLCCVVAIPMFACAPKSRDTFEWDDKKTQLWLFNYEAGYGRAWVDSLIARFEKATSNISFEEGKRGVQVRYEGSMSHFSPQDIGGQPYNILFTENDVYYELSSSPAILDLTDVVLNADMTVTNEGGKALSTLIKEAYSDEENGVVKTENQFKLDDEYGKLTTIWDRMNTQQKAYLDIGTGDTKKIMAVPSYASSYGIIYDRARFEEQHYFFVFDENHPNKLIFEETPDDEGFPRSAGPDGEFGTYDDGLPATYDEFFALCGYIHNNNDVPICWPGKYYDQHITYLAYSLLNDYLGYEDSVVNFSFNGEMDELIELDNEGNFKFKEDGTPYTESKYIDQAKEENGYEVNRSAALYYTIGFVKNLLNWNVSYYDLDSDAASMTHTGNQLRFMEGGHRSDVSNITMLIDGAWWQREATPGAVSSKFLHDDNYAYGHDYGWLPLPKATKDKIGSKNTLSDSLNAFLYIKQTGMSAGQIEAAKAFVLFANCYDSLLDFTKETGTIKGLKYDIKGSDYDNLSSFTKSYLDYSRTADQVYGFSDSVYFYINSKNLDMMNRYSSDYGADIVIGLRNNPSVNAKQYLENIYKKNITKFNNKV